MNSERVEVQTTLSEAVMLAVELLKLRRIAEAEAALVRILEFKPDHPDALHFLGVLRHRQDRDEEAVDLLRRALSVAPDYLDARNNLGNILRRMNRFEEAEAEYRRILSKHPKHVDALSNLGCVLRRSGDLEGAAALFEKAIEARPDHIEAWLNLGGVLRRLRRWPEAEAAFRRVLELRPESAEVHLNLGRLLYMQGRIEEAAKVYEAWRERDPESPVALHMLAACGVRPAPERASDAFVRETFDGFAMNFDEALQTLKYQAPQLVANALAEAVRSAKGLDLVLDAGCGTGLCGPLLRPLARRLVGVDLSGRMLQQAKARGCYDELTEAELTAHLASRPGTCDAIVSADVLVYFGALEEVFRAAAGALKEGGIFVFTTERRTGNPPFHLDAHGRYSHTEAYLRETLQAAGLLPASFTEVQLRMELGEPVAGTLTVARKPHRSR